MHIEFKKIAARVLKANSHQAILGNHPYGGQENSPITFVMVCREGVAETTEWYRRTLAL